MVCNKVIAYALIASLLFVASPAAADDVQAWTQVAAQLNSQTHALSLVTYNDGTGEAVYAGTAPEGRLFKYNSTTGGWSQVAAQLNSQTGITALVTYNDGTGDAVYGATSPHGRLFKYNTTTGGWLQVAAQLNSQTYIPTLVTYNDGTGEAVYAGTSPEGRLFKYTATTGGWSQVLGQLDSEAYSLFLTTYNDGTGNALYSGTYRGGRLLKYTTGGWSHVAALPSTSTYISSLTTYNDGSGDAVYSGTYGGLLYRYNSTIVGWRQVAALSDTQTGLCLTTYNDGTGDALYSGTLDNGRLFKYNTTTGGWLQVAAEMDLQTYLYSLVTYDDGTGDAVYAGTSPKGLLFKYDYTYIPPPPPAAPPGPSGGFLWCGHQDIFFWNSTSIYNPTGYYTMDHIPQIAPETTIVKAFSGSVGTTVGKWIIPLNSPLPNTAYTIAPGLWSFHIYAKVNNAAGIDRIEFNLLNRSASGVETDLFYGTPISADIGRDANEYLFEYARRNATYLNAGDRLVLQMNVTTTGAADTLTLYLDGNSRASRVQSSSYWICGTNAYPSTSGSGGSDNLVGVAVAGGVVGGIFAVAYNRRRNRR